MSRAALLLAVAAAGLGACQEPPAGNNAAAAHTPQPTPTPFVEHGWASVFGDAAATTALLGNMGYRLSPYAGKGSQHHAEAQPTPLSDPSAKPVDMAHLVLSGDAHSLSALRYTVDLVSKDAAGSKAQFVRWIAQPLGQLGVDGLDTVKAAIDREAGSGTLKGATYSVTRETIGTGRRLVVTFTRADATSGASTPRKQ